MSSTQQAAPAAPKKGKGKKAADPSEQQKQIQAKIAQLELDAAGDREQELEIGASCFHLVLYVPASAGKLCARLYWLSIRSQGRYDI